MSSSLQVLDQLVARDREIQKLTETGRMQGAGRTMMVGWGDGGREGGKVTCEWSITQVWEIKTKCKVATIGYILIY